MLEHNYRVAATARDLDKIKDLTSENPDQLIKLSLDVTNAVQVTETTKKVINKFNRIDVLFNNAGYGYAGTIEESEENVTRAMFETNFLGGISDD